MIKLCPKCRKPMREEPKFPGLWTCPDYRKPLNDAPPYKYACDGESLTNAGVKALERELFNLQISQN